MQASATKHGQRSVNSTTGTYKSWLNMKQRCNNPRQQSYSYYGGRGISYDHRWEKFENFFSDMGERLSGMTLDRIDSNGNYTVTNCRWLSMKDQAQNRRLNCRNISGHSCITWDKSNQKWLVVIKNKNLGRYKNIEDAVQVKQTYLENVF